MTMKKLSNILLTVTLFLVTLPLQGQELKALEMMEDTLTNEYLDSISIRKKLELNDYSMIGFQYGTSLSRVMWNPTQKQDMLFMPVNFGVMYTRY